MARMPSPRTHDQPGRANSVPGFSRRRLRNTVEDIAHQVGHRLTPSQIMQAIAEAVADSTTIGHINLAGCTSEADLKGVLMHRFRVALDKQGEPAMNLEGQG